MNVYFQEWWPLPQLLWSDLGRCTPMSGRCQWVPVQSRGRLTVWPICITLEWILLKTPALVWLDHSLSVDPTLSRKECRWEKSTRNQPIMSLNSSHPTESDVFSSDLWDICSICTQTYLEDTYLVCGNMILVRTVIYNNRTFYHLKTKAQENLSTKFEVIYISFTV